MDDKPTLDRLGAAIQRLDDTLIVTSAIQERQASFQKLQAEELAAVRTMTVEHRTFLRDHDSMMKEFDRRPQTWYPVSANS